MIYEGYKEVCPCQGKGYNGHPDFTKSHKDKGRKKYKGKVGVYNKYQVKGIPVGAEGEEELGPVKSLLTRFEEFGK